MHKIIALAAIILLPFLSQAQKKEGKYYKGKAEVSCGSCQLKQDSKSCDLAVRIKNKTYLVAGKKSGIDDYGDSHADDGFCNTIRTGEVEGTIKGRKFYAKEIKLDPAKAEK